MICSFCGTREDDARALIVGPFNAAICDRCVELSAGMVKERLTPIGDMALTNIGQLATNNPRFPGVLGVVSDAVVAIRRGRIAWAGPSERLPQGLASLPRLDCGGRAVIPGLIDAHTHLLFGGDRMYEFALRSAGVPEAEVVRRGGGPSRTAQTTRKMSSDAFAHLIGQRLVRMLESGTTTAEAAGGYSTNHEHELDLLDVAGTVNRHSHLDLVATFDVSRLRLVPSDRSDDLEMLADNALPEVADLGYGIRVAHGKDSLTTAEAHTLLSKAATLGTRTRLHREGAMSGETADLALDVGAAVIDHCGNIPRETARALGARGVAVVATPTTRLADRGYLPPLWDLIRLGVPLALGTDCGPYPVWVESMPLAIAIAVAEMGLTPDQAVWSATRGGAIALGFQDRGWIAQGATADLVVLDAPSPTYLSYRPGADVVWKVLKNGAVVVSK